MSRAAQAAAVRTSRRKGADRRPALRLATPSDGEEVFRLISAESAEGRLLPRTADELRRHLSRFTVVVDGDEAGARLLGGAELAPLGNGVAEVRSLVVREGWRGRGLASMLVRAIQARARRAGVRRLSAFTHEPDLFLRLGFQVVPHEWVPEKIAADCEACPLFGRCGQTALICRLT
jgi:amino-acid N-acetyltransferase